MVVLVLPAHQIEIGRGQHCQRHARIRQTLRHGVECRQREARCLGDVADGDPAAILEFLRAPADVIEIHAIGRRAEIQMHVDVDVVVARQLEDAVDLAGRIAVGIGRAADHAAAAVERRDNELVGARIVEETLLREHADLEIDRPGILLHQRQHAFEPAQPDAGIDFKMRAHVGRALQDRLLERAHGAGMNVLRGERRLGLGRLRDRLFEVAALGPAAVEDARFVEMDVGLDETGRHQATAQIDGLAFSGEARFDGGDVPAGDADIGQFVLGADAPRVPENEVHGGLSSRGCASVTVRSRDRRDRRASAPGRRRLRARCPNA